jgi:hypothetical protein
METYRMWQPPALPVRCWFNGTGTRCGARDGFRLVVATHGSSSPREANPYPTNWYVVRRTMKGYVTVGKCVNAIK